MKKDIQSTLDGVETRDRVPTRDFSAVAEEYRPQIFRSLLAWSRNVDLAETLTQECFLNAYCAWSRFRGNSSTLTWLTRIAINLQKDYWRNRRMQFWRQMRANSLDMEDVGEWLATGERSPEQRLLACEQLNQVWKIVEGLGGRQRAVLILRYVEEMELSEIAHVTGLCEGTVKAHLSRAVGRVRVELEGRR